MKQSKAERKPVLSKKGQHQEELAYYLRLAAFPAQNPNPVIEINTAGDILYHNHLVDKAFPDLLKLKFKHPVLNGIETIVRSLSRKKKKTAAREVTVGGRVFQEQIHFAPKNDLVRLYLVDITEERNARNKLREAEKMYRTIFENSAVAITVTDAKERIVSWNNYTEKMLGFGHKELYLKPVSSLYSKAEWKKIRSYNIRKKGVDHIETKINTKTGETIDVDISISILRDQAGDITGSIGILRDVTERKIAERRLREAEKMYRTIFENSAVAITVTDAKERIVSWNNYTEKMLGFGHKELYLKPVSSLYSKAEWKKIRSYNIRKKGMQHHLETRINKKDGEAIDVDISISILRDESGSITGSIGIIRDITERKIAEAEMKRARDSAEAANRSKSEFLANMSHEIRTPINGIMGMIGLLLDTTVLTREQTEYAQTARDSTESLLTIMNDILDFSKIEAGKMIIEPIPFDLRHLVEEVADLMALKAEEKDIELIVQYSLKSPRRIVGDPGRIRQIFMNFVTNAVKFTEKGHVLINVYCREQKNSSALLRFEVKDTGIGIPKEQLDYIFEKFTQADASMTRRYGGTGLGLAISKQLTELMGGRIGVESRLNRGSTFFSEISFPIDTSSAAQSLAKADVSNVRALIVDDNAVNRRVLREQLTSWRMRAEEVDSGEECLKSLREAEGSGDPYKIAILDFGLPGIDGQTLGRIIKADPLMRKTILVMLTSHGLRGDAQQCLKAGFSAYLVKPVRQSQLFDVLAMVWGSSREKGAAGLVTKHTLIESKTIESKRKKEREVTRDYRVLVVEDNIVNQKVAVRNLENLGCSVDVAANGKEALHMLKTVSYDMIFMDCQMPEMDGYEATKALRLSEGTGRRTPIIAMTANAMKEDRSKCLMSGMDDYLSKPVKSDDFRAMLQKWGQPGEVHPSTKKEDLSDDASHPDSAAIANQLDNIARGEDEVFVKELIAIYLESSAKSLDDIIDALRKGEFSTVGKAAHTLKGSSGNIGAQSLVRRCDELERSANTGPEDNIGKLVEQIKSEYATVKTVLEKRLLHS